MAYSASLAGSKLRAKLGASLNEHVSAPPSDFAQKQLVGMGWRDGEGLGKRRQGMSKHITVTKREDNVGLGHSEHPTDTQQWWKDSVSDTLAKLGCKKKKKKRKVKEYTDEELFEATGGARFGMRAQRRATGKWARTESQTEDDEQRARERVEWNGRGDAKVKLDSDSGGERKKKKRRKLLETEASGDATGSDKEVRSEENFKKKKDKKPKKKSSKKSKKSKKSKELVDAVTS